MPERNLWSRRNLLTSAAGALFLAPFLRLRELEASFAFPKRLVLAFTPNSHPREWWPIRDDGPRGFSLTGPLLDFAGLEQYLFFVRRLDHSWTFDNHHDAGMVQLFTGQSFFDETTRYANGPSIDQLLLRETGLRGGTPIADIHLCAADLGGGNRRHVACYSGPGQPIQREPDPLRAFGNVFSGVTFGGTPRPPSTDPTLQARRAVTQKTLEIGTAELRRIQGFLGQAERERLELHVEALRELEIELARGSTDPTTVGAACQRTDTSGLSQSDHDETAIVRWGQINADLVVNAFACDRTRVAELAFGASGSHHTGLLNLTTGNASWHDAVAHLALDDENRETNVTLGTATTTVREAFVAFDRLWASQIAYLARRLSEIPEGDGTMLDNTLIYWGVECGTDHSHGPADLQYLLIGGQNMGFRNGTFLELPGVESAHKLHTSVLHGFGYSTATGFGIEPDCGPLAGVLA